MNTTNSRRRGLHLVVPTFLAALVAVPALGEFYSARQPALVTVETVSVIQPSVVARVITNVIEVRVPTNIFINLFRTNQFVVQRTNIFDVYRTNLVTRTLTNTIVVEVARTNLVTQYRTNLNNLTLTNWENVLVFKTNWITRPNINTVEIDLPARADDAPKPADAIVPGVTAATAAVPAEKFSLAAVRTRRPPINDQVEISLKLRTAGNETPTFESQEWQVERTDGSVLLFGQGPEFRRALPLGDYKVEVKAKPAGKGALVRVRGFVEVTREEVIQQRPAVVLGAR